MKHTPISVMIVATVATVATPILAQAASSIQLRVIGTVALPSCDITAPDGAAIKYGKIASDTLKTHETTPIGNAHTSIRINCYAPTLFAIKPTDARAASKITVAGLSDYLLYGLGTIDGKKIGAYTIDFTNAIADGKPTSILHKESDTWTGRSYSAPVCIQIG